MLGHGGEMDEALEEVLELWRGKDAGEDAGHPLREEEFHLRREDGTVKSALFPWSQQFEEHLRAAVGGSTHAQARDAVGRTLYDFLVELGWEGVEEKVGAGAGAREVRLTVRCWAAEVCRLPLELVKLKRSGGEVPPHRVGEAREHGLWRLPGHGLEREPLVVRETLHLLARPDHQDGPPVVGQEPAPGSDSQPAMEQKDPSGSCSRTLPARVAILGVWRSGERRSRRKAW